MTTSTSRIDKSLAPGAILALLAVLFGFGFGGVFGAAEGKIKDRLATSGDAALATVYGGDVAKKDAVLAKAWSYMKRSHLHGGAMGTAALAAVALLGVLGRSGRLGAASAAAFGAGALLYGVFWMVAGFAAPQLGGTDAAKEAYSFLAIPGAGLSILGMLGTLASVIRVVYGKPSV